MTTAQKLQTTLAQTQADVANNWPEVLEYILPVVNRHTSQSATQTTAQVLVQESNETVAISQEERLALKEQLRALAALPPGQLDGEAAKELALKLSFVINHPVTFAISDQQLVHTHGTFCAIPKSPTPLQPLWPIDAANRRQPLRPSTKQWFVHVSPTNAMASFEGGWESPWWMYQQVLVLQPQIMIAVVGQITGILTEKLNRYQFGASPAFLQQGGFWGPGSQGRGIICFLAAAVENGTTFDLR